MVLLKGMGDFFALDIGTNAIRVVQLSAAGPDRWKLEHYGYSAIDSKKVASSAGEAKRYLGEAIFTTVSNSGIRTKNVAIGLPSQKTFTTVIDMPAASPVDLKGAIKYQIDKYVPMSADEAQVDWVILGQSPQGANQQEVLLSSTASNFAEERLELVEGLGFNVIAAEPDAIAMTRASLPEDAQNAYIIIDMGEQSSDISINFNGAPRLVRTIPMGLSTFTKSTAQNLNVQEDQARQFILKFGLEPTKLDGVVANVLQTALDSFVVELGKSIKFFQTRYPNIPIRQVLLSGAASIMPQLGDYMKAKTSLDVIPTNPWQKVAASQADQQKLAPVMHEFATALGLAQRRNKQ